MAFTPRLTAPSASDLRWIMTDYGGYNGCIAGSDGEPSVLPNCTGYVHGRWMEIGNLTSDNMGLSFGNAVTYYSASDSSIERSSNPSLGAIACYRTTTTEDGQPGHVAVVEEVIDDDTIVISESHYGGARFDTRTVYRQYGWQSSTGWDTTGIGFLVCPYVSPEPDPPHPPSRSGRLKLWMKYYNIKGGYKLI